MIHNNNVNKHRQIQCEQLIVCILSQQRSHDHPVQYHHDCVYILFCYYLGFVSVECFEVSFLSHCFCIYYFILNRNRETKIIHCVLTCALCKVFFNLFLTQIIKYNTVLERICY